ncbi:MULTISPECIES: hypothetical protein [Kitasatospora]|uniref:hypothetical protein n=1 Tax=Kitasatospora TaxID=2063 RepID=UPI0031D7513C
MIGTAALLAAGLTTVPASAASSGPTTTTFQVQGGTLDITTPASAAIGQGPPGGTISGQLGNVLVADGRALADASWTASVISTDFTSGAGGSGLTIPATDVSYWSGPVTSSSGNGVFTPGQPASGNAAPLNNTTPLTALTHAGGTGNNTATWTPSLNVHVPQANESGTYTGTVTHSVA